MPPLITPSILSADFSRLGEQIKAIEENGAKWVHIDVMDGHFVPNITMGQFIVKTCKSITELPLDIHLMVDQPEGMLSSFANAGANGLTIHTEASHDQNRTLQTIRSLDCKPGIAINPDTQASAIESALSLVDVVLVMTVNPGLSGQNFISETLPKITKLRKMLDEVNPEAMIQVDGGINTETITQAQDAGANVFAAASAIFNHRQGIAAGMKALNDLAGNS